MCTRVLARIRYRCITLIHAVQLGRLHARVRAPIRYGRNNRCAVAPTPWTIAAPYRDKSAFPLWHFPSRKLQLPKRHLRCSGLGTLVRSLSYTAAATFTALSRV